MSMSDAIMFFVARLEKQYSDQEIKKTFKEFIDTYWFEGDYEECDSCGEHPDDCTCSFEEWKLQLSNCKKKLKALLVPLKGVLLFVRL